MDWKTWLSEVANIKSIQSGSTIEASAMDTEAARTAFSSGKTPSEFVKESMAFTNVAPTTGPGSKPLPLGAIVAAVVLGALVWNCGGTFGIPFGPAYMTPEERAKNRAAAEERDAQDKAEVERKMNPMSYIALQDFTWEKTSSGNVVISSECKNASSKRLEYVSVSYKLKDASGRVVGTALDNTSNLNPGEVWKIEAPVIEDGVKTAELDEVKVSPAE